MLAPLQKHSVGASRRAEMSCGTVGLASHWPCVIGLSGLSTYIMGSRPK